MHLNDQLNALHTARTPEALRTELAVACRRFVHDAQAMAAISGAFQYRREQLADERTEAWRGRAA